MERKKVVVVRLLGCYVALMRGGKNGPASNVTLILEVLADARRATPSMIVRTEPMTNAKNLILTLRLHNFPFSPTARFCVIHSTRTTTTTT